MALKKTVTKTPVKAAVKPAAPVKVQPQPSNLPVESKLFGGMGGLGGEGVDRGAFSVPFLTILQALSPAAQKGRQEYVEGAEAGLIMNTVTKELFNEVLVTIVQTSHTMCSWTPRDDGGGFLGEVPWTLDVEAQFNAIEPDDKGRRIEGEKELTEHRNFFCAVLHEDRPIEPAIVSMTKSQLKASRDWLYLAGNKSYRDNGAVVWRSEIWKLSTYLRTKGENSWYVWQATHVGRHTNERVFKEVNETAVYASAPVQRQLEQIQEPTSGEM